MTHQKKSFQKCLEKHLAFEQNICETFHAIALGSIQQERIQNNVGYAIYWKNDPIWSLWQKVPRVTP